MIEIVFNHNHIETIIQANLDDSFNKIIQRYINKSQLDINNLYFTSNGQLLQGNEKNIMNIMNSSEQSNKRKIIFALSKNTTIINDNTNMIKSNDIICPKCKEICIYEIEDHKIKLLGCKNGHIMDNIKLDDFNNQQNINISQIICDKCKNISKSNTLNNEFYICYECKINLCPFCKSMHDKTHHTINYDHKNYICNKHNERFVKYCNKCKTDLCLSCINEHENHELISYEDQIIDINKLRNKMGNLKKVIDKLKMNLEEIIKKFNKLKDNLDTYYNINNNIINNGEINEYKNYNLLKSLKNINNDIDKEINKLKYEYSYGYNLNSLLYLYNEINDKNLEIEIQYKPIKTNTKNKKEKLRVFGKQFIKNNINKCKIIYNNFEYDLCEYIDDIIYKYNSNEIITIKLKGYNNITDMSYIFQWCESLSSLPDISNWNTSNINDMSSMFSECKSLSSLPDVSKWNTSNVNNMNYMFNGCESLSSLPDISKWDTSNVNNMNYMFNGCKSLSSLPDLSKWNTSNVNNMSGMFYECESLSLLPDISKWNTSNVNNMSGMFKGCESLSSLPDISIWDTSNVNNMSEMFLLCKSDLKIPSKFIN